MRDLVNNKDEILILDYIDPNTKEKIQAKVLERDELEDLLTIDLLNQAGVDSLKKIISLNEKVTVFDRRRSLSFLCVVLKDKWKETRTINLKFPDDIAFYERRKIRRATLSKPFVISIRIVNRKYQKNSYDLGEGGFSMIFSKADNPSLEPGMTFKEIDLTLGSKKIQVAATVVRVIELTPYQFENYPYGGKRISFKFEKLTDEQSSIINTFMDAHDALMQD